MAHEQLQDLTIGANAKSPTHRPLLIGIMAHLADHGFPEQPLNDLPFNPNPYYRYCKAPNDYIVAIGTAGDVAVLRSTTNSDRSNISLAHPDALDQIVQAVKELSKESK